MDTTLYGVALTPLVIALVQAIKEAGMPGRFAPLAAILLGLAAGVASQYSQAHPVILQGAVIGIAIGLSAAGLYSGVAAFTKPVDLSVVGTALQPAVSATDASSVPASAPATPTA